MELNTQKMFVRYISHEIRTPMNIVFAGLKLLDLQLKNETINVEESLCLVWDTKGAADVALTVLNDMLMFDKIKTGLLVPELSEEEPCAFIEETVSPFQIQVNISPLIILMESVVIYFLTTV